MHESLKYIKPAADPVLTIIYWTYFTLGYLLFFLPFYLWHTLFSKDRQVPFQKLNHLFYKGFFCLVHAVTPGLTFKIDPEVREIRSSIIVSNHISYLDPILLISLYDKQKTIVKSTFFKVPFFGWVLKQSGYIPSTTGEQFSGLMLEQIDGLNEYLASGGNFFVFPEGTRSRDGKIGKFNKGLFKIAKKSDAPIKVLHIRNTGRLFRPGKYLFNTCVENTINVSLIGEIPAGALDKNHSIMETMQRVRSMMEEQT